MQIGLLGQANVGKSTFFSAATETVVQTGNFPFTTIEPNIGVTHVKVDCACQNLENRCGNNLCIDGIRFIPVKLIDVAGLVPGAPVKPFNQPDPTYTGIGAFGNLQALMGARG